MSQKAGSNKRKKANASEILSHINSQSLSNDFEFLTGPIDVQDPFLWLLLSGRMMNSTIWNLFEKSDEIKRKQLLIDERNKLKLDDKSKSKRLILNRLIHACLENSNCLHQQTEQLIQSIRHQISDPYPYESIFYTDLQLYDEVQVWRRTQCRRRLFFEQFSPSCNLLTLQRLMTDQFIHLINQFHQNPNTFQETDQNALIKFSLVIVVQPCGTDCVAATKYEKEAKNFVAKLKTRIICLLDPVRTHGYLTLSDTNVVLQTENDDLDGDPQASLTYKTRTIMTNENIERTFSYFEMKEIQCLKLTKLNTNGKPSYNRNLCKLKFQTLFQIDPTFHINVLKTYICQFHRRLTGVEVKLHTENYIKENLQAFYRTFEQNASSPTTDVMFFSWNIYEERLTKLFSQIRFLSNQPCLALILCRGITNEAYDKDLEKTISTEAGILIRFEEFTHQEPTRNPYIIVVKFNGLYQTNSITIGLRNNAICIGTLSISRISHEYLLNDICRYCERTIENSLHIFADDKLLPFSTFCLYYDDGLNRNNFIQSDNYTIFHLTNVLMQNNRQDDSEQSQTNQQNISPTFYLSGKLTGRTDAMNEAMTDLKEYFATLCKKHNIHGTLFQSETKPFTDVICNTNELDLLSNFLLPASDVDDLLTEHDY
ncbi:hypothetical protein I4U23_025502 [Adineta vaga]|nr:hypothetical protein I4U23_025502 [Adineta vaga]